MGCIASGDATPRTSAGSRSRAGRRPVVVRDPDPERHRPALVSAARPVVDAILAGEPGSDGAGLPTGPGRPPATPALREEVTACPGRIGAPTVVGRSTTGGDTVVDAISSGPPPGLHRCPAAASRRRDAPTHARRPRRWPRHRSSSHRRFPHRRSPVVADGRTATSVPPRCSHRRLLAVFGAGLSRRPAGVRCARSADRRGVRGHGVVDASAQWRFIASVERHGASIDGVWRDCDRPTATGQRTQPSCSSRCPGSVSVDAHVDRHGDNSDLHRGDRVLVRYDTEDPERAFLPDNRPEPWALWVGLFLGACPSSGSTSWRLPVDIDRDVALAGTGWVLWSGLAGLTTWIGFGHVGARTRRTRHVGMGGHLRPGCSHDPRAPRGRAGMALLEPVGVAVWLVVWIGGALHGLFLMGRMPPVPPPVRSAPA